QAEIDIDELDSADVDARLVKHAAQHRYFEAGDGIADSPAGKIGDLFHRPVGQHRERVERGFDERTETDQRNPGSVIEIEVRLIVDADLCLSGCNCAWDDGWI